MTLYIDQMPLLSPTSTHNCPLYIVVLFLNANNIYNHSLKIHILTPYVTFTLANCFGLCDMCGLCLCVRALASVSCRRPQAARYRASAGAVSASVYDGSLALLIQRITLAFSTFAKSAGCDIE